MTDPITTASTELTRLLSVDDLAGIQLEPADFTMGYFEVTTELMGVTFSFRFSGEARYLRCMAQPSSWRRRRRLGGWRQVNSFEDIAGLFD